MILIFVVESYFGKIVLIEFFFVLVCFICFLFYVRLLVKCSEWYYKYILECKKFIVGEVLMW